MIKEAIEKIVTREDLTYDEAYRVMNEIMSGKSTPTQNAAFLAALSTKSAKFETIDEISGCAAAMREHAIPVDTGDLKCLEIVGTGGDGANSFNISTTSSLVIAAAGVPVAKHGNRAASSKSGAADVLEALGVKIDLPPERSAELLKTAGNFTVKFSDDVQTDAAIICMDDSTGIGLISVSENKLTSEQRDSLSIAVLDNSYMVNQGDLVIAAGKLYETVKGVGYGTIAGIKTEYAKDAGYEIFETNITVAEGGFAILFNSEGKVVGISKSSSEASGKFMGISDLKGQLETMINHHGVMYCGITGQNVTDELTAKYNLPNGVYISNIDIDSPAYYAGLQAGDVISAINGQSILTIQQFSEKLYQCADGDTLLVTVKRQGKDGYSDVSFSVSVQLKQLN